MRGEIIGYYRRLYQINDIIEMFYRFFTKPFVRYATKIVLLNPISNFYFRPLHIEELYMALGLWEPRVRQNLCSSENACFIDVGAHIGYHTVYVAKRMKKNGLIIAIEPDKRNQEILCRNISAVGNSHIIVFKGACGPNGFLYLKAKTNPLLNETTAKELKDCIKVSSINLDHLANKLASMGGSFNSIILKIDVEGGEMEIIRHGLEFFKKLKPVLIVEASKPRELIKTMWSQGYSSEDLGKSYFIFKPNDPNKASI